MLVSHLPTAIHSRAVTNALAVRLASTSAELKGRRDASLLRTRLVPVNQERAD